ncbi:MAG: response regulator [Leptospiraceae bacterium]|nr:response regulator [Leptospiraceae bacterium]
MSAPAPWWVGIGSSAGGLEALRAFIGNLPEDSGKAYIILQHIAPDKKSLMIQLLARETTLPVLPVTHELIPQKNTIYVTPANHDVIVHTGRLRLSEPSNTIGPKPSVDRFFISMSNDRGAECVGIVLSGTGNDGAMGLQTIKAAGGITIAQEPKSARYDSMPNAAIRIGGADFVLAPEEIAEQISDIADRFEKQSLAIPIEEPHDGLKEIIGIISEHTEVDFENYKEATLNRQVIRRIAALQLGDVGDYAQYLKDNHEEIDALTESFLISVTGFFRDRDAFDTLSEHLDELLDRNQTDGELRVWIPACSTGEEVYSIVIMLLEKIELRDRKYKLQVFATDINQKVLNTARTGIYPESSLANVDQHLLDKYFTLEHGSYKIRKFLKDPVLFARHDIIHSPPFLRLDLVCCRNLLIYFKQELQHNVLTTIHYALKEGGLLFLGKSESIGRLKVEFTEVQNKSRLYQKRITKEEQKFPIYLRLQGRRGTASIRSGPPIQAPKPQSPPVVSRFEAAKSVLAEHYIPPAVLITDSGEALEFFGDCSRFLKIPTGKANFGLFNLLPKSISAEIRALLHRVIRSRQKTVSGVITPDKAAKPGFRVVLFPAGTENTNKDLYLLTFEEQVFKGKPVAATVPTAESEQLRIEELENEIEYNRENLQTVIEEFETANEELQALNEESQASNEELQASNEELETANEELQAANEELITVNDELNSRTKELSRLFLEMQNIMNSIQKGILVTDRHLIITRVNQSAYEYFDLSFDSGESILNARPRLEIRNFAEMAQKTMERKRFHSIDATDRNGNTYMVRFYPFIDLISPDEDADGLVVTIQDISERVNAIRDLEAARQEAERANRAKSAFLANMSHEIRTPLSGIIGFAELLLMEDLPADVKTQAAQIFSSSRALLHILNDILDHSKIESGKIELEVRSFDLAEIVKQSMALFAHKASEKGLQLKLDIDAGTPRSLLGDSARLQQVLNNLISNAVKFTDSGEIGVRVRPVYGRDQADTWITLQFTVSDTGFGIDKSRLEELFQPFRQADDTIARKYGGTGLGLSICKSLVEFMGGSIHVESEPGRGSIFRFTANFERTPGDQGDGLMTESSPEAASRVQDFKGYQVLIAEDNPVNSMLLEAMLKKLGTNPVTVANGQEAIERIRSDSFQLVFMDMMMPEMDGIAATKMIRTELKQTSLPIIALTANAGEEYRRICLDSGMNDYLSKPIELDVLKQKLGQWLPVDQTAE